jgi:hypothetical protein
MEKNDIGLTATGNRSPRQHVQGVETRGVRNHGLAGAYAQGSVVKCKGLYGEKIVSYFLFDIYIA